MNNNLFYNSISGKQDFVPSVKSRFRTSVFAPKRILLAEDNPSNQRVTCGILEKFGFRTDIANNGREAVAALKSDHYDMVLMDIQMPVTDGIQATEIIRDPASGISCTIPVIAVTANASENDRERYFAAGMNDCIPKPIDPALLLSAMERQFTRIAESKDSCILNMKCRDSISQPAEKQEMKKIFDKEDLLLRVGGDEKLCKTLINMFVKTMKDELEQLKASIDSGDAEQARLQAHSIKGMASNISSSSLYETAHQSEIAGENGDLEKVRALTAQMECLFADFLSLSSDEASIDYLKKNES